MPFENFTTVMWVVLVVSAVLLLQGLTKSGKNKRTGSTFLVLGIVGLLVVFAFPGVLSGFEGQTATVAAGTSAGAGIICSDSTGTLTVNAVSALDGAADPSSPTITCGVNGDKVKTAVTSGTTTFPVGANLECLVSKADYIDRSFQETMDCGGLVEQVEMFFATSDNPTLKLTDPNAADATLSDAIGGGAVNLTNPSAGSTIDFDVEFKGTNTEGTGNMIYVIEFPTSSGANITDVTMGNLQEVTVPTLHEAQNAGSEVVAFSVPNVIGATKETYSVIATFSTTGDISGGVYTDVYAAQEFIDDNGFITSGVEDSDGTATYENTLDYDFLIS